MEHTDSYVGGRDSISSARNLLSTKKHDNSTCFLMLWICYGVDMYAHRRMGFLDIVFNGSMRGSGPCGVGSNPAIQIVT